MSTPKVSIIIPVYNKEKYLRRTLDSLVNQELQDFELIIVNDGSTDKSKEIIAEYVEKDCRINAIDILNNGVSNARNVGLENANGKWIQFLDADDYIQSDYLSTVINNSEAMNSDIVFSDFLMVDEKDNIVKKVESFYSGTVSGSFICDLFIKLQMENGFFGFISNKLFKRQLLDSLCYFFDTNITLAEDLDFYSRVYQHVNKAFFINIASFCYLQTAENYLHDDNIDYRSQLEIRLNIKKWFINVGKYCEYKKEIDTRISQYVYLVFFYENEKGNSLSSDFDRFISDTFINESIIIVGTNQFTRDVIQATVDRDYNRLCKLFKRRNFIRSIYRKVIKHG